MSLIAPNLLIPASSPDFQPRGGILLNSLDSSRSRSDGDPDSPSSPVYPTSAAGTPAYERASFLSSPGSDHGRSTDGRGAAGGTSTPTPRIRFAPLPDPHRPRSASAGNEGQSYAMTSGDGEGSGGHQTLVVRKGYDDEAIYDDDDEYATDGEVDKRGRRWSKSMGMGSMNLGWKETKKLLTGKSGDEGYDDGAPLKKSISTGGFIGSSPFRWTIQDDRKKAMLGSSLPSTSSIPPQASRDSSTHRRNSSLEASAPQLGSSPSKPVKLLNGRVYGSRRASQVAQRSEEWRRQNEPAFVEWGNSKSGAGLGSLSGGARKGALLGDDDDGSGMDWVRKRREKKEREEKERLERVAEQDQSVADTTGDSSTSTTTTSAPQELMSPQSSASSPAQPITPAINPAELPPTPMIHISEHTSPPAAKRGLDLETHANPLSPIVESGFSKPATPVSASHPHLQGHGNSSSSAMNIVSGRAPQRDVDVFDNDKDDEERSELPDANDLVLHGGRVQSSISAENAILSESEEEEEDGDFSDDDEEEEDVKRTTSSAAGVEKISRHKD